MTTATQTRTVTTTAASAPAAPRRAVNITLWITQSLLALMFIVAAGLPKVFGEATAARIFNEMGWGDTARVVIGLLEIAGGIGLLIPRLSSLAATGISALMIGAVITQVAVLDDPVMAITPAILCVIAGLVAWARRAQTRALLNLVRR